MHPEFLRSFLKISILLFRFRLCPVRMKSTGPNSAIFLNTNTGQLYDATLINAYISFPEAQKVGEKGENPPPEYTPGGYQNYAQEGTLYPPAGNPDMPNYFQQQVPPMPPMQQYYLGQAQPEYGATQVIVVGPTYQQEIVVDERMKQETDREIDIACCMFMISRNVFSKSR